MLQLLMVFADYWFAVACFQQKVKVVRRLRALRLTQVACT